MESLTKKIQELILADQNNILPFRQGKISQVEITEKSQEISGKFLEALKTYGFPYKDTVQEDIYKAGITLSLHLPLVDMEQIFNDFIKNVPVDKINPEHKAIFVDKIRILSGKPQLYGTQYKIGKNHDVELLPLENENDLENIRKSAGLSPMLEYLKQIQK